MLCIFIVAEIFLRIFDIPFKPMYTPTENAIAQFDDVLGWSYLPNLSRKLRYGPHVKTVHFNKDGIRVPHPGFKFDYKKPSVIFIGGSFTMGDGLNYEETFIGQLEKMDGFPYQLVNLGVQAFGTDQAFLALQKHWNKFNTKVVVYTFIEQHIMRNGNHDRRLLDPAAWFLGTKPLFALDHNNKLYLSKTPQLYQDYLHSYFIDLIKIKIGRKLHIFPAHPEQLTKAIIRQMNLYCNNHDALFMMINWRWDKEGYSKFRDLHIDIIDTLENAPAGWSQMKTYDGHPNFQASQHVANQLYRHFRKNNLL